MFDPDIKKADEDVAELFLKSSPGALASRAGTAEQAVPVHLGRGPHSAPWPARLSPLLRSEGRTPIPSSSARPRAPTVHIWPHDIYAHLKTVFALHASMFSKP